MPSRPRAPSIPPRSIGGPAEAAEQLGHHGLGIRVLAAEKDVMRAGKPTAIDLQGRRQGVERVRRNDRASDLSWLRDRAAELLR